jgi:hypothetical protein
LYVVQCRVSLEREHTRPFPPPPLLPSRSVNFAVL